MRAIEISGEAGSGRILRIQSIPDDYTVAEGRVTRTVQRGEERIEHTVFPPTTRWYPAPEGAREGDTFDPDTGTVTPPPPPPVEEVRARKIEQAVDEASRRRQAVLDAVTPGGLADYVSLMGRALAGVRREAKGRADPDEISRLNALEALSDQIEAIDTARDTIIAEIGQHPDPASYDVPGSPHWP